MFIYCLANAAHTAIWVLVFNSAIHPISLAKNKEKHELIRSTRNVISYTVVFNILMCAMAFWMPVVAMTLTAMAWVAYMFMGIFMNPIENEV